MSCSDISFTRKLRTGLNTNVRFEDTVVVFACIILLNFGENDLASLTTEQEGKNGRDKKIILSRKVGGQGTSTKIQRYARCLKRIKEIRYSEKRIPKS
jgi:hypothetical protein